MVTPLRIGSEGKWAHAFRALAAAPIRGDDHPTYIAAEREESAMRRAATRWNRSLTESRSISSDAPPSGIIKISRRGNQVFAQRAT